MVSNVSILWGGIGFLALLSVVLTLVTIVLFKYDKRMTKIDDRVTRVNYTLREDFEYTMDSHTRDWDHEEYITDMTLSDRFDQVERDMRSEFENDIGDIDNIRDSLHTIGRHIQVALEEKHEMSGTLAKLGERFRNI